MTDTGAGADKPLDPEMDDFAEFCRTAKREVITLNAEAYDAFVAMLEAPPRIDERLRELMQRNHIFESGGNSSILPEK